MSGKIKHIQVLTGQVVGSSGDLSTEGIYECEKGIVFKFKTKVDKVDKKA